MKNGALTGSPWRFASSTCPISWTKRSTTRPMPNHQPPIQTYTAADTKIENRNFALKSTAPNFTSSAPTAASGARIFFSRSRSPDRG